MMSRRPPRSTLFPYTTLSDLSHFGALERIGLGLRGWPGRLGGGSDRGRRSEEHTPELQSQFHLVCRLPLETKEQGREPDRRRRVPPPCGRQPARDGPPEGSGA